MEKQKFVAYLRRSKKVQESTLGLESQLTEVQNYVERIDGTIVNTYTEIESGTNRKLKKRRVIWDAINECMDTGATLIIAKLDRLARDVEFTARLQNTGIKFVACDVPQANEFTIHVMSAVAQQEAKRISERTKAALKKKKDKGEPLGWWTHRQRFTKLDDTARRLAVQKIQEKARQNPNNRRAKSYCMMMREKGVPYSEIAERMNNEGYKSPTNKKVTASTVYRWVHS